MGLSIKIVIKRMMRTDDNEKKSSLDPQPPILFTESVPSATPRRLIKERIVTVEPKVPLANGK